MIIKNSRQIPKTKNLMSNELYSDMLYSYLQVISYFEQETGTRFIPKKEIKFTQIAEALNITRQTASAKFKKLLEMKLLILNEKLARYEFKILDKTIANLVPVETLRKLVSAFNENTINIYMVILNNWYTNKQKPYALPLNTIKTFIGLSTKTRSNNYIITDLLEILKKLKLLNYELSYQSQEDGSTKTIYLFTDISLEI